jgi:hypothetical protein
VGTVHGIFDACPTQLDARCAACSIHGRTASWAAVLWYPIEIVSKRNGEIDTPCHLIRSGSSAAAASRAAASSRFSSDAMRTALSAADGGYCGCAGAEAGSAQNCYFADDPRLVRLLRLQ